MSPDASSLGFTEKSIYGDLEYYQDTATPFIQLLYFTNADRLRDETFHRMKTNIKSTAETGTVTNLGPVTATTTDGKCTFEYSATQTVYATYETVIILQLIMSRVGQETTTVQRTPNADSAEIRLVDSPRYVLFGSILFMKDQGNTMTLQDVEAISLIYADEFSTVVDGIFICENGNSETLENGDIVCTCNPGYFGNTCTNLCSQGNVITLQPHDRQICECNMGFGDVGCGSSGHSVNFVTKMSYRDECPVALSNHFKYLYAVDESGVITVREVANIAETLIENFEFGDSTTNYDTLRQIPNHAGASSPFPIMQSSSENDFLLGIEIPVSQTHSIGWNVKITHANRDGNLVGDQEISGNEVRGTCGVWYGIVQRYNPTNSNAPAMADIFFVLGQAGYSKFPTSASLDFQTVAGTVGSDVTSEFSTTGEISGVIFGYTLVVTDAGSQIAESELIDVMRCYADYACSSLPQVFECVNGQVILDGNTPTCSCDGGWVGPECAYPC
uniref:uncharacterized protein LOC120333070 n=1 Tax=Styela clava TaxID=7725 RepID=UPI001939B57B|nr:uncharacterized protein LOC120333070 [Styela clava]